MKIKQRHIQIAKSSACHDYGLHTRERSPKEMLKYLQGVADQMGVEIVRKPKSKLRWFQRATSGPYRIFVDSDWGKRSNFSKALTLSEELAHVRQWNTYWMFGPRYVMSKPFRWAVEIQAKRDLMWAARGMGKLVDAEDMADAMKHYLLERLRRRRSLALEIFKEERRKIARYWA